MPKDENKKTVRQKDADEMHVTSTPSPTAPSTIVEQSDPTKLKSTVTQAEKDRTVAQLDITLSSFRDALRGTNTKDFSTIQTVLDSIKNTDGIKKITDTVTVTATDFDIRDLSKAQDEIYSVLRTDAGVAYDARDRNWTITESVPVTGTFWQATQPVSGTFWQATQPVSGTFWQATQPVSGTLTVTDVSDIKTAVQKIDNQEDGVTYAHVQKANVDGDIVAAPGAGFFLRVHHIYTANEGANFTIFEIEDGTTVKWRIPLAAEGGVVAQNLKRPWDLTENAALHYDHTSGASALINITVGYETIAT